MSFDLRSSNPLLDRLDPRVAQPHVADLEAATRAVKSDLGLGEACFLERIKQSLVGGHEAHGRGGARQLERRIAEIALARQIADLYLPAQLENAEQLRDPPLEIFPG